MMMLVTGGSKCGKSRFAESVFKKCTEQKFYIATMKPYGSEAYTAIASHRKMRENKGFFTIEQYTDIDQVNIPNGSAVLLECIGNLLANEMFGDGKCNDCADKIIADILRLKLRTNLLVMVTNQVGCDGIKYDCGTAAYIAAIGKINQALAEKSDRVTECVYGIPVTVKG